MWHSLGGSQQTNILKHILWFIMIIIPCSTRHHHLLAVYTSTSVKTHTTEQNTIWFEIISLFNFSFLLLIFTRLVYSLSNSIQFNSI